MLTGHNEDVIQNWAPLKEQAMKLIEKETEGLDDISKYTITSEFVIDFEMLVREYLSRAHKSKGKGSVLKLRKSEVEEAASILLVNNFKHGKKLDMAEVQKSFRKLARASHPDLHGAHMEWKFKEIQAAYSVLKEYDEKFG
jgi:hypothetical protein